MQKSALRAIVLDDSPLSAKLVRRMLERSGFEVKTAVTFEDFRKVVTDFPPDVVFSDLQMPDFPDDSVCRVLRREGGIGAVPIWILSSLAEPELASRAEACSADGYLSKSMEPTDLEARLRALGQRWTTASPRADSSPGRAAGGEH